jgi:ABC-type bacteriocin/lantibiotic exporter with double-glycine peptidase domain
MRLECQDITYGYAGSAHPVIENLSLTIDEPGLHALFGPSGVGKSSLAKVMAKMVAPQSGTIRVDGDGPVFYSHNMERLPDWSPVGRHMDRITPDQHVSLRTELIAAFGLEALLGHRFSQLSLGQQNRINLLRYLVQDFQVLIMDESLANVDEQTREQILLTIKGFFPDSVFIYISHNVGEVATFCRQIWVLRDRRRSPQVLCRIGLDFRSDQLLDRSALDHTMLEMMSAD